MKKYKFEAWVHPINGGDDECYNVTIVAPNKTKANNHIEKWLSKKSMVTKDYILRKTEKL